MSDILIRKIEPADNATIASIIRGSLAEFGANHPGTVYYDSSTDHLYEVFRQPGSIYLVAEEEGLILGGAGIYPTEGLPPGTAELVKMYLIPQARKKGLGSRLITACIEFAREQGYNQVYLETMPELSRAMTVYERFGFEYLKGPMGNSGHFGCHVWMLLNLEKKDH